MKKSLSSLDYHYLLNELQWIVGSKFDKAYSMGMMYLLQFHKTGAGKIMLKIILPDAMFVTENKEEFDQPTNFCMSLRKCLGGAKLVSLEQKGFERIIEMVFETRDKRYRLFIELFSKGNMILCDEELTIVNAHQFQKWSARTIRGGIKYDYPKKQIDFSRMDVSDFSRFIDSSEKNSVVIALATDLGLGGEYAEKLCMLANIEKSKQKLDEQEKRRLFEAGKRLLNQELRPTFVEGVGFFPFEMLPGKAYDSFNKLLDEYFTSILLADWSARKQDSAVEKHLAIIKQQESQIQELTENIKENQKIGDTIYTNYQEIQKLIGLARNKDNKELFRSKILRSVDQKKQELTLEIE
jgi:predicted ribosome quality control (RQC) complex YloA/Tae2 family protein